MTPSVFWFTGLSGAGKTTVATAALDRLKAEGHAVVLLDGDVLRNGLCNDLGFSISDRTENIRRVAEVSRLFLNNGISCLCTFISPTVAIRNMARSIIGASDFNEIYVNTPLDICEQRDPKGLYRKVRQGELFNFTGVDSVYEQPEQADFILNCGNQTVTESVLETMDFIHTKLKS